MHLYTMRIHIELTTRALRFAGYVQDDEMQMRNRGSGDSLTVLVSGDTEQHAVEEAFGRLVDALPADVPNPPLRQTASGGVLLVPLPSTAVLLLRRRAVERGMSPQECVLRAVALSLARGASGSASGAGEASGLEQLLGCGRRD
ncbi:hypothetical protein [Streptomyces sp. STCH 565 A]|uniref:hypothetical protein n=1 Tax=Streptomyces sp. STCH 565 A TaxID=2950532 RepID=UPI002075FDD8|nr:hypothetical protein [Streptomyces sp. STCH 565 A]MCM8555481.1 hypothetical protein [Streptomyces sp. STCH 565 A]